MGDSTCMCWEGECNGEGEEQREYGESVELRFKMRG